MKSPCPHCWHENPPDSEFCTKCGKPIPPVEPSLRQCLEGGLREFIGQTALKEAIRPKIELARATGIAFPHLLLCGEKESGKATFAAAIAGDLDVRYIAKTAESFVHMFDLTGVLPVTTETPLTGVPPTPERRVLTIVDVEVLRPPIVDLLVGAVSRFKLDLLIGKVGKVGTHLASLPLATFTLIATTAKPWLVNEQLRRWCIACEFAPYSSDEAVQIVLRIARQQGVLLEADAASEIARQCRGRAGEAAVFLQKIANTFRFGPSDRIGASRLRELSAFFGSGRLYPSALTMSEQLQTMEGVEFERWVADLFRKAGFGVELTQTTGDHGVDLWISAGGDPIAVQCKRWDGSVGEPVIRDLYGAVTAARVKRGCVVTTGTFTVQARQFAQGKPLLLIDFDSLMEAAKAPEVLRERLQGGDVMPADE